MLRGHVSGNTFNVKEAIKGRGFKWNATSKNWTKDALTLTIFQSDFEELKAELEAAGIRVAVTKVEPSDPAKERLVWWDDFGQVTARMLSTRNEDEEDDAETHSLRSNAASHFGDNGQVGAARPSVANAAPSGAANNEEVVIEIPQWLARQLGCSRVLRGHFEGQTENREYTRRDGRTGRAYMRHFVGHNEIGGTSRCYRCGRELTDPVSRAIGYGAECCRNIGISRRVDMQDVNNIRILDAEIRNMTVDTWIPSSVIRARTIQ